LPSQLRRGFLVGIFVGIPRAIFTRKRDNRKSYLAKRGIANLMDTQRSDRIHSGMKKKKKKCQRRVNAFDCVCGQSFRNKQLRTYSAQRDETDGYLTDDSSGQISLTPACGSQAAGKKPDIECLFGISKYYPDRSLCPYQ